MDFRNHFEYDTAYPFSNQLDLPTLSTAIDNDGADEFFGNNSLIKTDIKQEVMSPLNLTLENESNENSTSEYMTPMTNNTISQDDFGDDKENKTKTAVNRQIFIEPDCSNGSKIDSLNSAMKTMKLSAVKLSASARKSVKFIATPAEKVHPMETRLDTQNTPTIVLRSRSVIRKSQACLGPDPVPEHKKEENQHLASEGSECAEKKDLANADKQDDVRTSNETVETCRLDETKSMLPIQSSMPPPNIRMVPFGKQSEVLHISQPTKTVGMPKRGGSPLTQVNTKRYTTMAEDIYKFQKSTPDRFHTRPRASVKLRGPVVALRTTVPHSPALVAKSRFRPVNYPTHDEKEAEELREAQSHKVAALPFNPKVFKTPNLGKPIEKRPPTAIEPFHLTEVAKTERAKTPEFNFTARPIPKGLLHGVSGLGKKLPSKLTDPVTPSFEQRRIAAAKRTAVVVAEKDNQKVMGQQTIFHFGTPFVNHRRSTEVVPFSFDKRNKLIQEQKDQKIKQILEEDRKRKEFHANPIPRSVGVLVNNNAILPNAPVMSMFMNDGYKARRENLIKAKIQEEEELVKKLAIFKAKPATVVRARPFEPTKPETTGLEVQPFDFNTERRAKEWQDFEKTRKAKEEELDVHREQRNKEKAQKEAEELAAIRKEAVHRANPVPKINPFNVKPSEKELTVPVSPFRHREAK